MAKPNDPAIMPSLPQGNTSPNIWDPTTISNIIFSSVMVFIGIIALWQAHRKRHTIRSRTDEESTIGIELLSRASTLQPDAASSPAPNASPHQRLEGTASSQPQDINQSAAGGGASRMDEAYRVPDHDL